ncbi:MAG TPA: DUF2066 domain-containing protein [Steroidobacteraceae bacterium]|nr:DUF2066 domain-containing protein [Steroidobacteraceae bacterium]
MLWVICCSVSPSAWAGRPVRVYEVDLKGGQSPAALQDAMREALVRATGRRESANDPAFASLIAEAPNYVKSYTSGARGQQVIFDSAAVERAIAAAGRSVWDRDRPFTLVMLYPPPARPAEDAARAELEQAAISRGLPVTLVPLSPLDASGNDLGRDALMQMAQRYGGDAVLVGRGDLGGGGQWQWTLYTNFSGASWSGSLTAGIDGAVDSLASPQGGSLADTEALARVEVDGVNGLSDYANVQRLLESLPGARRASVASASGGTVVFDILIRGGAEAVSSSLAGAAHLSRTDASSARLAYQYRP